MQAQARREPRAAWSILLCCSLAGALLHGAGDEPKERLLHLPASTLLMGYPEDDVLYITRDRSELTLRPPGPKRGGHHTYPSLSRDGTVVATSYVKTPYPNYREGVATYSFVDKQWQQYSADFTMVWAMTLSPDGSRLAFKAERDWSHSNQLLMLDLNTGVTTVVMPSYPASAPLSWSPDGRQIVYERPATQNVDVYDVEIGIRDLLNQQERRLVSGRAPSWSPSGQWIAYLDSAGALALVHPDGTGATALASLHRSFPWFYTRLFMDPPVWSPDSHSLLLNEAALDETARALIHRFDLGPRKLQRRTGKGVEVLGWASGRPPGFESNSARPEIPVR